MACALRTGTLTFPFTDVAASTPLLSELGTERYARIPLADRFSAERDAGIALSPEEATALALDEA